MTESLGKLTEEEHAILREKHQAGQQIVSRLGELSYHVHRTQEQLQNVKAQAALSMAEFETTQRGLEDQMARLQEESSKLCTQLSVANQSAQEVVTQVLGRLGLDPSTTIVVQPDGNVMPAPNRQ